MRKFLLGITVVVVLSLISIPIVMTRKPTASVPPVKTYRMAYRYTPGQVNYVRSTRNSHYVSGGKEQFSSRVHVILQQKVAAIQEGAAMMLVEQVGRRIKPDGKSVDVTQRYACEKTTRGWMTHLQTVTGKPGAKAKFVSPRGIGDESLVLTAEGLDVILPETPVKPGDTWKISEPSAILSTLIPFALAGRYTATYTFVGLEQIGKKTLYHISSKVTIDCPLQPGDDLPWVGMTVEGEQHAYFDPRLGNITQLTAKMKAKVKGAKTPDEAKPSTVQVFTDTMSELLPPKK